VDSLGTCTRLPRIIQTPWNWAVQRGGGEFLAPIRWSRTSVQLNTRDSSFKRARLAAYRAGALLICRYHLWCGVLGVSQLWAAFLPVFQTQHYSLSAPRTSGAWRARMRASSFWLLAQETGSAHEGAHSSMLYWEQTGTYQPQWPEAASELYRPSDLCLSAKLVTTFADRWCHVVCVTDPYGFINPRPIFPSKQLLSCTHEAEWTPFHTHYFSENLVAKGNWTRDLWHYSQELWSLDHRGGHFFLNNI
jgi:hypothetical protein